MKRIQSYIRYMLMTLMVMACMFLPKPARAQWGVIDVANLGESIYQFIEQNFQHAEEMLNLAEQLQTAVKNLENTKQTLETMKKTFQVAKQYFDAAGVLLDVYNLTEQVYRDGELAYQKIQQWSTTGAVSPTQVYALARVIKYSIKDVEDIVKYLSEQVFNEENQMTTAERLIEVRTQTKEAKKIADLIPMAINSVDSGINDIMKDFATKAMMATMSDQPEVTEKDVEKFEKTQEALKEELEGEDKPTNIKNYKGKDLKEKVINIVFISVTVLAIIFFGWNFGVYNHGDKQRSDVLWKVGAGYIIMLIVIQIFKLVIFDMLIK